MCVVLHAREYCLHSRVRGQFVYAGKLSINRAALFRRKQRMVSRRQVSWVFSYPVLLIVQLVYIVFQPLVIY
ncbi:hypothetical protein SAMN04487963_0571 [Marinobacter zhejiangensis]|uniref:Uncharacterized protein n=1 Tax=Marinobacter zhejiangensis TaxID=488535 RepID=A0A1I4LN26_9GAMM|nr:hypothetical protein SAMN04487963_0571 [Marinobacter zhejiangensis]